MSNFSLIVTLPSLFVKGEFSKNLIILSVSVTMNVSDYPWWRFAMYRKQLMVMLLSIALTISSGIPVHAAPASRLRGTLSAAVLRDGTDNPPPAGSGEEDGGSSTDPGTGGGSTTDPGTGGGGTADPGTGGGGTTDPGTGGDGTTDPGTGEGGTTDPGTGEGGTTDPGTGESGTTDPGTGEGGTTDPGSGSGNDEGSGEGENGQGEDGANTGKEGSGSGTKPPSGQSGRPSSYYPTYGGGSPYSGTAGAGSSIYQGGDSEVIPSTDPELPSIDEHPGVDENLPDENNIEEPDQEDAVFKAWAEDSFGNKIKSWYSRSEEAFILFLPQDIPIPDLVLHTKGLHGPARGRLDPKTGDLTGAFGKSGDSVKIYADTDESARVEITLKVMQSDLPSLHLSLSGTTLKEIISGSKSVKYEGNSLTVADRENESFSSEAVTIKGRGNTTWVLPTKKSYQIKFTQKTSMLGMDPAKKWVLLANAFDDSMAKNAAAFDLAKALDMEFAPDYRYADLWIDGEYLGTYMVTEKVEIGKNRLNLQNPAGVLMEQDFAFYEEEDFYTVNKTTGLAFALKDIKSSGSEEAAMAEFDDKITAFFRYLYKNCGSQDKVTSDDLNRYIDLDSLARYYLMTEFCMNMESYATSFYWYTDGPDDVLHAGPVWDFDTAFGVQPGFDASDHYYAESTILFGLLLHYPAFVQTVRGIYEEYRPAFAAAGTNVTAIGSSIARSAKMNYVRWDYLGNENQKGSVMRRFAGSYEKAVRHLSGWLTARYGSFVPCTINLDSVYDAKSGYITMVIRDKDYDHVTFAVWSTENSQDDIVWLKGERASDGNWAARVKLSEFLEEGTFMIHAYAYNSKGDARLVSNTQMGTRYS